jgi:hypothetical protein
MKADQHLTGERPQLFQNSVAVGNARALRFFENDEQRCRLRGVVPITFEFCDNLALPGDVLVAERNILFSQSEMLLEHFSIHLESVAQDLRPQP